MEKELGRLYEDWKALHREAVRASLSGEWEVLNEKTKQKEFVLVQACVLKGLEVNRENLLTVLTDFYNRYEKEKEND